MDNVRRCAEAGLKARDVMTPDVVTVSPSTTISALCRILDEHDITGAPVVDEEGRVIGIVSQTDILVSQSASHVGDKSYNDIYDLFSPSPEGDALFSRRRSPRWVEDIMTKKVIAVEEDVSVQEICARMSKMRIHRIPVVRGDKLVGIISALDLITLLAGEFGRQDAVRSEQDGPSGVSVS